jgi:hypothetical protein
MRERGLAYQGNQFFDKLNAIKIGERKNARVDGLPEIVSVHGNLATYLTKSHVASAKHQGGSDLIRLLDSGLLIDVRDILRRPTQPRKVPREDGPHGHRFQNTWDSPYCTSVG